jgi:hypothetical protein
MLEKPRNELEVWDIKMGYTTPETPEQNKHTITLNREKVKTT